MTMFITVIALIALCWLMGKYNKSDNLFWILLVSLLAGMAGGAIFNKLNAKSIEGEKNNVNLTQVYIPTQVSPATSIDFYAMLGDARTFEVTPASKDLEVPAFGSKINVAPSMTFGEIRGQPNYLFPRNKGTPGMPFDTS